MISTDFFNHVRTKLWVAKRFTIESSTPSGRLMKAAMLATDKGQMDGLSGHEMCGDATIQTVFGHWLQ